MGGFCIPPIGPKEGKTASAVGGREFIVQLFHAGLCTIRFQWFEDGSS